MGYEFVEQLGWEYPDAVFYPTGGGVGLIGMWKAFDELEELGWVRPGKRPRMIAVQSAGCAPVARAFDRGAEVSQMWQNASTFASGLRVPKPYGDAIMLEILRESGGVALALPDDQILASLRDWAKNEGIFLSPEGAAATAAYDHLTRNRFAQDLRPSGAVQHRLRPEIYGCNGCSDAPRAASAYHLVAPEKYPRPLYWNPFRDTLHLLLLCKKLNSRRCAASGDNHCFACLRSAGRRIDNGNLYR